ncbi:MAG: putative glycosyltransferase YkoT [Candidatus Ordinivivax streblomastigis]|uniref:Putative glycosyltransferase YkoT n=1 Tax=Candidatus Ordinivivax streblomastigis TaxID=2540710 RepID=A0A5M8NV97_9BACT|nr:MAG: putative glycosyltransferase YkoT [Candidatus Ordinivivax streblomastigis]
MKDTILYIVMPAYNEEVNIESVISQWHPVLEKINELSEEKKSRLLIANDGSKDHTYEIMNRLKARYPFFEALDKPNSGHGATVLFLYNKAIKAKADYIFQTDSDGQTDPNEFWQFWENRQKYDFIIGARNARQDGFGRIIVTRVLRLLVWIIFGEWIQDSNTPFRLMKTERLSPILNVIPEDFFLCNVVISTIAVKWNERCQWVPITFKPRQGGINSINFKRIFKIGWKAISDFKIINKQLKK